MRRDADDDDEEDGMSDEDWQEEDGVPPAPLLGAEESYQGVPALDFENSRAEGVRAFAAAGVEGSVGGASGADASKGLVQAWSDASASGGRPLDFSFLLEGGAKPVLEPKDDHSPGPMASPCVERATKKRGRMPPAVDNFVLPAAAAEHFTSDSNPPKLRPAPQPPRRPQLVSFGKVEDEDRGENAMDPPAVRTDVYHWMRGEGGEAPEEVLALMREENQHADEAQAHLASLRQRLYAEMMGHFKEADTSHVTLHPGGYGYLTRTYVGKSYQAHFRCRALPGGGWGDEELVLDENELAIDPESGELHEYCSVSGPYPSPDHSKYAFATDFAGNDSYTLHVSGPRCNGSERTAIALERTDGSCHWSNGGDCFYYVELDGEFRQYRVKRHVLGQDPLGAADEILLEEADKKYSLTVAQSSCLRYLLLMACSAETAEVHLLDLVNPSAGFRRLSPRRFKHHYSVDHRGGWLYLLTNKDGARNYKLSRVPVSALPDVPEASWEDVWVPPEGAKLESHHCFSDFMVLEGREKGECRIYIHGYGQANGPPLHAIAFPDAAAHCGRVLTPRGAAAARAAFSAHLEENNLFETEVIRYHYSSFTLPGLSYEYHVGSRESRLVKRHEAPNFEADKYRAEKIVTPLRSVPVSLVYRKDLHPKGLAGGPFPTLMTGYGAYGACQDPDFDGNRLSLLDRGMIYAVVHVRGGGELGHNWHEEGKNLNVKARFADFVEAAETLVSLRLADPSRICAWGTSSGGLLVTASTNLRPDLFRALLLEVPFVDVMNTMCDPAVPLTVGEWEEIGNPNEREYFYYMQEYSPYENLRFEAYPAALITASLNDSMVGYWEPLKYAAKLRSMKTDDRPVFVKTNFHAGHGASSDRYECTREAAYNFAFLLDQLGLAEAPLLGRRPHGARDSTAG